jgi:hypothetical protein
MLLTPSVIVERYSDRPLSCKQCLATSAQWSGSKEYQEIKRSWKSRKCCLYKIAQKEKLMGEYSNTNGQRQGIHTYKDVQIHIFTL